MRLADGSSTTAGDGRASRLIGNMMRLANDSAQPNLKLLYWPPPQRGGLPRRAFRVTYLTAPANHKGAMRPRRLLPRPGEPSGPCAPGIARYVVATSSLRRYIVAASLRRSCVVATS